MAVVVDPKKIARAIGSSESTRSTPAAESPEASSPTEPKESPPPVDALKIARAIMAPNPRIGTPASEANPAPESIPPPPPPDPVLFTIRQLGRLLDDIEQMRIMNGNRVGAGQREGIDLPWMATVGAQLNALEHGVKLELKRAWRKHPLAAWAKTIPGAGEILMGRLIAEIGNPADRPNPGKLLAYCGHGDPIRSGAIPKGATQAELFKRGNPHAKKATWKLAYQFMRTVGTPAPANVRTTPTLTPPARATAEAAPKSETPAPAILDTDSNRGPSARASARSPYRDIYDERKASTEGKTHARACVRCGPSGHPAAAGTPWSDAHRHHDALRIVGKRFLIDLWVAAKELQ